MPLTPEEAHKKLADYREEAAKKMRELAAKPTQAAHWRLDFIAAPLRKHATVLRNLGRNEEADAFDALREKIRDAQAKHPVIPRTERPE
jgi:hypothetical protein